MKSEAAVEPPEITTAAAVAESESSSKDPEPEQLQIPAGFLAAESEGGDDLWSWGLSPRVVPIRSGSGVGRVASRLKSGLVQPAHDHEVPVAEPEDGLEPDLFLQVVPCHSEKGRGESVGAIVAPPKTPKMRQLREQPRCLQQKPDTTFLENPGTFFAAKGTGGTPVVCGEPRAVVVRREVESPPANVKPHTLTSTNHNKTLVLQAANETTKPRLALVRELDNTTKPNFARREPRKKVKVSAAKKFRMIPFSVPEVELSTRERRPILSIPADKGSKLELLQKRLAYDARKYAKCKVKTGSSSDSDSDDEWEEEEEEEDESSDNNETATRGRYRKSSPGARASWARGGSNLLMKQRTIIQAEEILQEADRDILATLESRAESLSTACTGDMTTREEGSRDASTVTRDGHLTSEPVEAAGDRGDLGGEVSDSSDVSVTAEDIAMFDRWLDGDTPTSFETADRAASIEIQQALGIDPSTLPTSPTRRRKRTVSSEKRTLPSSTGPLTGLIGPASESTLASPTALTSSGRPGSQGTTVVDEEGAEGGELREEEEEPALSLGEFMSDRRRSEMSGEGSLPELDSPKDEEELRRDLTYTEPSYVDVLSVKGRKVAPHGPPPAPTDRGVLESDSQLQLQPSITLLSTWAPEASEAEEKPFSIHHFCTMAVQPQLPRVLHNITRRAHNMPMDVTMEDVRSETSLSWFEEEPASESGQGGSTADQEPTIQVAGAKIPLTQKQLYWTPAPPKMDLPPLFIRTHLFPKYESAIATAEQQALMQLNEPADSPTTDEETESPETDEEDRALRARVMSRRHNSASIRKKKKRIRLKLGPHAIEDRGIRLRRPGSAPILDESTPRESFPSDYYSAYGEMECYQERMYTVQARMADEAADESSPTKVRKSPVKYDKLVLPYLERPISSRGVICLTPSYTKLLPITRGSVCSLRVKVTKAQVAEVEECLGSERRPLTRSTSAPSLHEEWDYGKRAGSCTDLTDTEAQWPDHGTTVAALRQEQLPVFARKLGTILSKDIVMLHQIMKKDDPEKYSDTLNEIHRLSAEIETGTGDYVHYSRTRRGALYVMLGMFKEAKADLDAVIEVMPKMADAYWHRHLIHVSQGDLGIALNDLTNIIRHNQNQSRVYLARAEIYHRQGDITGAILNYSQALKRDPDNAETFYKRAALFEEKGDILLALEDYTVANKLRPSNTVAIFKKGTYNFERGAYSVAVADFTSMLQQEPYNSTARTYRGRAYAKMGKYTAALEDLSCAVHLDPGNYLPFYHRAVLLRKENAKRALQDFSVAIMLDSTIQNRDSLLHRGVLYTELQRFEEAVPDFEAVTDLDWSCTEAHINLGLICMLHLKQYKRAIRCFTAALGVEPTSDRAYVCRADAYRTIKKHSAALIDYTRAIHIRPDIFRYYLYRGKLLLEMGHLDLASKHIKFASVLTPNDTSGSSALQRAVVQSFLRNYDEAIFVLDRAAGLDPSPFQYILLGKTYLKAKRYGEAVDNFEKALMYLRRCRSTVVPVVDGMEDYKQDLQNLGKKPKVLKQEMPKSASEVYFLIGKCHVESGNYPAALEALNSAIRINPSYAEAYFQRGLVRIWVRSARPLLDFNRALAYNPAYFQAYLTRAAYFGMRGRYSKALFNCNEALRIQPNSVRAYLYRGALKFETKNYPLAIQDLSAAIKLDPLCSLAFYNRAVCYQHVGSAKEALRDYGIVLLIEKEMNQKVLLNRGLLYYQGGEYNNALVDFKLAVKDAPENALLFHTLGLCYHRNNQLTKALETLTHAMKLQEHFIQAYISRGNVYMSINSAAGYTLSKRDYCRALHYDPTNLSAHTNLGIALQSNGKMNEAWKQFTAAINISPDCHAALEARSIVNLQMGHLFGAFCDINHAVKLHPTPTMLTNRGVIHQYMGEPMNAMTDFRSALEADPKYSLAYFNAANLYFNLRLFEKALRYYDEAVKNCKEDESTVLNRAIARVMLRDYVGAMEDFHTAISLNPFAAHSYFNRGNLHLTLGNNAEAEEDFRKALSLQPKDSASFTQLAVALGRQFRKEEALENYRKSIKLAEG